MCKSVFLYGHLLYKTRSDKLERSIKNANSLVKFSFYSYTIGFPFTNVEPGIRTKCTPSKVVRTHTLDQAHNRHKH